MYIEKVNSPADVKKLSVSEMNGLGGEIRQVLLNKLSSHGGHVGPNLGMVEATIALHYVFDSPTDKIVYDVSHQSYTHKILSMTKSPDIPNRRKVSMTFSLSGIPLPPSVWQADLPRRVT